MGALFWLGTFWLLVVAHSIPVGRATWSRTWVATSCTIVAADAVQRSGKVRKHNVRTNELNVLYRYLVNGEEFTSKRFDFTNGTFDGRPTEELDQLKPGTTVRCYYNPSDPSEATLAHRGFGSSLMAFLVILLGGVGPVLFLDGKKRAERLRRSPFLDAVAKVAAALTVLALAVGMGLSIFAGAPVSAWLVFTALPVVLVLLYRKVADLPE